MPATMQHEPLGLRTLPAPTVFTVMARAAATQTDFGGYLRKLATANGYSQASLAQAAGINQTQMSRAFGNAITPSVETLRKLAPLLNVRLGDLMIRAGMATAAELGTAGAAPPPLPPVVRDILQRLGPKSPLTERQKRALQAHLGRSLALFDEVLTDALAEAAPTELRRR
jgi:transcriptional regulator with XRE-family HTH domain